MLASGPLRNQSRRGGFPSITAGVLVADVDLLRCPRTGERLTLARIDRAEADDVLEGTLGSHSGHEYPVRNGIPRFVGDASSNPTWDYKWREIDSGRGLNYRIIDRDDPAYAMHDIFDRNDHGGRGFEHARDSLALDVGCGVGQYTVKLLQEHAPRKVVALDLTGGVDIFRKILAERYPDLLSRVLIVQGDALALPFADETFDFVMSLGVLMHTGRTLDALRECGRVVVDGGELNVWIYASEVVPIDVSEAGREGPRVPLAFTPLALRYTVIWAWLRLFRRLPHRVVVKIVRAFSSAPWRWACRTRGVSRFATLVFPSVVHDDPDYRFINNYDGYVNNWQDTWSEHEVIPVLQEADFVVLGLSQWRLGIWAVKKKGFYAANGAGAASRR